MFCSYKSKIMCSTVKKLSDPPAEKAGSWGHFQNQGASPSPELLPGLHRAFLWHLSLSGPQQALPECPWHLEESLIVQGWPRNQHLVVHNSQALAKAKPVIFLKRPFPLKNRMFLKLYFVETSWPIYEKLGWPHIDVFNFKRPCGLLSDSCK